MTEWPFPYVIIASSNQNKIREFRGLFYEQLGIEVKGLHDIPNAPEVTEDADTFEGNARKKAEEISKWLNVPVISDDSGLVVPALDGEPGIYSARYAGEHASDLENNEKLLQKLRQVPCNERGAYYVCVMALAIPGEETLTVRGELHGVLVDELQGSGGFGYDPLFYLPEEGVTMAELGIPRRQQISHRSQATKKLIEELTKHFRFAGNRQEKQMRVLIVSDSHGKANLLKQIVEREKADYVIHCGDFCTEKHELPKVPLSVVKGNCDWEMVPEEEHWEAEGLRFYATHGHRYNVKATKMPLRYRAEEVNADIVCYGHTHIPIAEMEDGRLFLNPGSISLPIVAPYPTYVILTIMDDRTVQVSYRQVDGRPAEKLGGTFVLKSKS